MVEGRASARAGGPAHHSPAVYSIAAHRGFADALVAGLIPRYGAGPMGLAGLTLLVPSQRAARTITEAFIRAMGAGGRVAGLLLPRLVAVGDLDLDEALEECDILIVLVDHDLFRSVPLAERAHKLVYDTRGIWPDQPATGEGAVAALRLAS